MAENSCTFSSDFTYHESCRSLGPPMYKSSTSTVTYQAYVLYPGWVYITAALGSSDFIRTRTLSIQTDTNSLSCLPGPRDCTAFSETDCPQGHTVAETEVISSTTTLYCCPIFIPDRPDDFAMMQFHPFNGKIELNDGTSKRSDLILTNMCIYNWQSYGEGLPGTVLPTVKLEVPTGDGFTTFQMNVNIGAYKVTYTTSPSPAPSLTLTLASSTSSFTPAATPSNSSNSLSTGAKAGIGVGASIGGLLFLATIAGAIFLKRRKKKALFERRKLDIHMLRARISFATHIGRLQANSH